MGFTNIHSGVELYIFDIEPQTARKGRAGVWYSCFFWGRAENKFPKTKCSKCKKKNLICLGKNSCHLHMSIKVPPGDERLIDELIGCTVLIGKLNKRKTAHESKIVFGSSDSVVNDQALIKRFNKQNLHLSLGISDYSCKRAHKKLKSLL